MKYLILLMVLTAGLVAQNTPYSQAGIPDPFEVGTLDADSIDGVIGVYVDLVADSITAPYFTSTDSLYWYNTNYKFYIRQAADTAGDRDICIVLVEEDSTEHTFEWNDGIPAFLVDETLFTTGNYLGAYVNASNYTRMVNTGAFETRGYNITIDPINNGAGTAFLGQSGDADIIKLNAAEFHTASTTYDSTATLAAGVYMCILDQIATQDTLNLPAAASHTGRMVVIKCVNANGSVIDANSTELIDDSQTQAMSQWDALVLFDDGTRWLII